MGFSGQQRSRGSDATFTGDHDRSRAFHAPAAILRKGTTNPVVKPLALLQPGMSVHRIFTFWEPANKVPPYLELCRSTWEHHLPNYDIITLDYSNMHQYVAPDVYDFTLLKRLPLSMQKDAIMVAVLDAEGGVFMDMDTIVLDDMAVITRRLLHSEVLMFGHHVAFVASRAHSRISTLWLRHIQERMSGLHGEVPLGLPWHFLGNGPLYESMDATMPRSRIEMALRSVSPETPESSDLLSGLATKLRGARRRLYFATVHRNYLWSLDARRHKYILERSFPTSKKISARDRYLAFWFHEHRNISAVASARPAIIGLHHSWTPDWYTALSSQDILRHNSLLSRTLDYALHHSRARQ